MADSKAFQKKANISLVMQTVRVKRQISRIEISRELGLDRSTITNIVSALIESGLLVEIAEGVSVSKGGRKPVLLGINRDFGVILGIEIKQDSFLATLITLDGSVIWTHKGSITNCENLSELLLLIYRELEPEILNQKIPLIGIGIGLKGQINPENNIIIGSSPFARDREYGKELSDLFKVPVLIDNSANCCTWGVLESRKEESIKNFIYSILSRDFSSNINSLSFGIVVNGSVYYGSNFSAGDFWRTNLEELEIDNDYISYFKKLIDKLSLFISFLNPSHLFLSGEFLKYKDVILDIYKTHTISEHCEVLFSEMGEWDTSFGAASMVIEKLFKIPGLDSVNRSELSWDSIIKIKNI